MVLRVFSLLFYQSRVSAQRARAPARAMPCLAWRGDPDTPPRACPDSGLDAWDERGTAVLRARAWPGHVAGLRTPVRGHRRSP